MRDENFFSKLHDVQKLIDKIKKNNPEFQIPEVSYNQKYVSWINYERPGYTTEDKVCATVLGKVDERFSTSPNNYYHTTLGKLREMVDEAIEEYGDDSFVYFDEANSEFNGKEKYTVKASIYMKVYEDTNTYYERLSKSYNYYLLEKENKEEKEALKNKTPEELKEIIMRMINGEKFQQICPVH